MPERIVRVRRKRRKRLFPSLESITLFKHQLSPGRAIALIVAAAVAIALCIILFDYGAGAYNRWHEERLLKRASSALQEKNFGAATQLARQLLRHHADSLPAYEILAEATEKQNLEETVSWRAQIARLQPDSLDSQLNLASAALRFGQVDLTRKTLERVAPVARNLASYHVLAGWLARAEGNTAEQEQQFAAALKEEPKNRLYQFNLAALQIHSVDPEKNAHAHQQLEELTQIPEFRTGAIRALLNDAVDRNDLTNADRLAQDLQMSPDVNFSDYLLCLNFYRKLSADKFENLLAKVKPVAARNNTDLGLLMQWMDDNGLAADVVKWMDKLPTDATANPPPAVAVGDAFAELKNWSRLRRWTRSGSWGDQDYLRLAYQAFASRQSRQSSADVEFDTLWLAAVHAANEQPDREIVLARLASKWNLSSESEQLWLRLAKNPPTRREALDGLYKIYRANNDLRKLHDVLQRLHDASPNEIGITMSLARLGLNIDQNTKQAQELAKQAYDKAHDDVNCAVTYAFSLYVQGRTSEGLEIIRALPRDALRDPHLAIYAAALFLDNNETADAKQYIQLAKKGPLYVEEKRLLEDELNKVAGGSPTPTPTPAPSTTPPSTPTPSTKAPASPSANDASTTTSNPEGAGQSL